MALEHHYQCQLAWTGEKRGRLDAPGLPSLEVATPPEFKGHPGMWTPEHLFVASSLSCLMTTFVALAEKARLSLARFDASAHGKLTQAADGKLAITEIALEPEITVSEPDDEAKALDLIEKAEKYCLVSNSMKSTVTLKPRVIVDPAAAASS